MSRETFRNDVAERDGYECIVPWCNNRVTPDPDGPGEQHHIIERELWSDGGYIPDNGVSVCNFHHRMAENNEIPPQAFWRWAEIEQPVIPLDEGHPAAPDRLRYHVGDGGSVLDIDKWGEPFDTPPHDDLRDFHKYPSTRHLLPLYWESYRSTAEERIGRDDTGLRSLETLLEIPLIATIKMDGSNAMLVKDSDEPVRARNGQHADHESFDHLKQEYWDRGVYEYLPEHLQVFGENMYAKHSIHYGCDGCCDERNRGPSVDDAFLVFGVFDTRYNLWLSWPETEVVADAIGFETVPGAGGHEIMDIGSYGNAQDYYAGQYDREQDAVDYLLDRAHRVVDMGHEGIIVRSMYPFHYGQFDTKIGKFVRPNHVQTDEHWSHGDVIRNGVDN